MGDAADLFFQEIHQTLDGEPCRGTSAEVVAVGEPGVRAWMDAQASRGGQAPAHGIVGPGVCAAGDVGRIDQAQDRLGARLRFAFAEIAVQVEDGTKRISWPGRHWANQERCSGSIRPSFG